MNLIHDPWIPVRDSAGQRHWITPDRLSDTQWRAFDADRPDFNGALMQFAIGLLQTTTQVSNGLEWGRLFKTPPDASTLLQWFSPVAAAFVLDGDGPRFMQDIDLGGEGLSINNIGALLIDSPGEQTVKNNADHFVKRSQVTSLCSACAALALFTLQLNAPSGGQGHRTGLRGGGPLTTLVMASEGESLWRSLWLNVRDRPAFLAQGGNPEHTEPQRSFPWLGSVLTLQPLTGEMAQSQVHPAHLYWAMPRRIRLQFMKDCVGTCDCCSRQSQPLVTEYATKNYGLNYKGTWSHPLSPYYESKEGWLALHPQPDGLGYRHWLAWVLGAANDRQTTKVAAVVERALSLPQRTTSGALRIWAFGYDMDNMKARCWYESTLPTYRLGDCSPDAHSSVKSEVGRWLSSADLAGAYLRGAIKDSWFSADPRGEFGHVDASFWSATESAFYQQLHTLIEAVASGIDPPQLTMREVWHSTLTRTAIRLFDDNFVGAGTVERQNPRRTALAHRKLRSSLYGTKLRLTVGLPVEKPAPKSTQKSTKRNTKETE